MTNPILQKKFKPARQRLNPGSLVPKTKTVKICGQNVAILANMSVKDVVSIWRSQNEAVDQFILSMVKDNPRLSSLIVHAWAREHEYYVIPKTDFDDYVKNNQHCSRTDINLGE